jgi:hypothetical protein
VCFRVSIQAGQCQSILNVWEMRILIASGYTLGGKPNTRLKHRKGGPQHADQKASLIATNNHVADY